MEVGKLPANCPAVECIFLGEHYDFSIVCTQHVSHMVFKLVLNFD